MATPASAYSGTADLLTVTVTPGTQPASTGITVQADLSAAGGSSSQVFHDDGMNGTQRPGTTCSRTASRPATTDVLAAGFSKGHATADGADDDCVDGTAAAGVCFDWNNPGEQALDVCDADRDHERNRGWREVERVLP